jgi:hypothetical protein
MVQHPPFIWILALNANIIIPSCAFNEETLYLLHYGKLQKRTTGQIKVLLPLYKTSEEGLAAPCSSVQQRNVISGTRAMTQPPRVPEEASAKVEW